MIKFLKSLFGKKEVVEAPVAEYKVEAPVAPAPVVEVAPAPVVAPAPAKKPAAKKTAKPKAPRKPKASK